MLLTYRDGKGNILCACEWWLVDELGNWNPRGEYVWVNQIEMAPEAHGYNLIQDIKNDLAFNCPQAKGAYWERRDKTGNRLHAFTRTQLTKSSSLLRQAHAEV